MTNPGAQINKFYQTYKGINLSYLELQKCFNAKDENGLEPTKFCTIFERAFLML